MKIYQYHIYPTMKCSLNCQHCFIDRELISDDSRMTTEQFKEISDKYAEHFNQSSAEFAEITIIGGEPSLMPSDFFFEGIPYLREKFKSTGKKAIISIVTNLLHYNVIDKIGHLFDFVVTSYEPLRFTPFNIPHNADRKKDAWNANLDKFIESGRQISISFTTSKDVIAGGTDMFEHFLNRGISFFQINTLVPEGKILENELGDEFYSNYVPDRTDELKIPARNRKHIQLTDSKIIPDFKLESEYFIKITEWLYEKRLAGHNIDIYPIKSFIEGIKEKVVIDDISCCIDKGINTRPDGKVTGCAAEIGSRNMYSYGNIFQDSVEDLITSNEFETHLGMAQRINSNCRTCEFFQNCFGSCMLRSRFWDNRNDPDNCHGLKPYLIYLQENMERLKVLVEEQ